MDMQKETINADDVGLLDLDFKQVQDEEQSFIQKRQEQRARATEQRPKFSLALSGGGVRAAAFQSGVIWRLAEAGRLRDVEYVAAVSGGAYLSAALSAEISETKQPETDSDVDSWYLGVVARMLCRMQQNAGGFIRDPAQAPTRFGGGLMRLCDAPALVFALLITLFVNPIELLFLYLVPITEISQLFYGAALRRAYCNPNEERSIDVLMQWSNFPFLLQMVGVCVPVTFAIWVLGKLPFFQLRDDQTQKKRDPIGFLMINGTLAFLTRLTFAVLAMIALLLFVPVVQEYSYPPDLIERVTNQTVFSFCEHYITTQGKTLVQSSFNMGCSNYYSGKAWYEDKAFLKFIDDRPPQPRGPFLHLERQHLWQPESETTANITEGRAVMSVIFSGLVVMILVSILVVPFFPDLILVILSFAGPAILFFLAVLFVQYRTYGPLTGQPLLWIWLPYNWEYWESFIYLGFGVNFVLAFFFNDIRRVWHWYYARCLRMNYFAGGTDPTLERLKQHPYCPFMLFTGTVSDYKQPGDTENVSEISFSGLHTGGEATGYVRTPQYQQLSTCTALSAAGCLDAFSLSMGQHLKFRFWLEMLNLSWGDYILFTRRGSAVAKICVEWVGEKLERGATWIVYRLPGCLIFLLALIIFWFGLSIARDSSKGDCVAAKNMVNAGIYVILGTFACSFFAFLSPFEFLMFSPIIRQMHQATHYVFQSVKAPGMLYVTDGGVRDCTAILQLMRRRCKRILLVLAAADPDDELGVLRVAMEAAVEDRIGSFYDPDDPKRDVRILLEEYKVKKEQHLFHIAIRYGWGEKEDGFGDLYVVKNRLPPSLEDEIVKPLITEEEVRHENVEKGFNFWAGLKTAELGGVGCCDCCHRKGCNCGMKFPHLTGANYLWLTPTLFSSLSRLGFEVSKDVVEKVCP